MNDVAALETMLNAKIAELNAAKRAANEVLKDLKAACSDAMRLRDELKTAAEKSADEEIAKAVQTGLEKFGVELEKAIETSTGAVFERFDTITAELLGETDRMRKDGAPSIPELAEAVGILNRADRRKLRKRG